MCDNKKKHIGSKQTHKKLYGSRLAHKQLLLILICSSIITLIGTTFQLYTEYRNDISDIDSQLRQISSGHLESLVNSLWKLDDDQVEIQMKDILSLRDIVYLQISENDQVIFSAGQPHPSAGYKQVHYAMTFDHEDVPKQIGTLTAHADLGGVHRRMFNRAFLILITQGLKTFIVSACILYIIHLLVIRHLFKISNHANKLRIEKLEPTLALDRKPSSEEKWDELDKLVNAINAMHNRLNLDIRQLKALERQLHQSHKMEALGTLTGGIAHDFNNILSIIIGNADLAQGLDRSDPSIHNHINEILKASLRAKEIIGQLLTYTRKSEPVLIPTRVSTIIEESMNLMQSTIQPEIKICWRNISSADTILADPTQINQVMINLFTNAFHAMESAGGKLEIEMKNVQINSISSNLTDNLSPGLYLEVSVKDNGQGIDRENLSRIFDPYFTTKAIGKGSGIGLAVVHGIISRHNGAIHAESTPGVGTIFHFYLPVIETKADSTVKPDTHKKPPTGNEKILFIDDEKSIVKLGRLILEGLGYDVETEIDPLQALKRFRSNPDRFDLVVTDMTMPEMSGDTLSRKILSIRADIPIILCTGYSAKIDALRAQKIGIITYLDKPLRRMKLATAVRQAIDHRLKRNPPKN